MRPSAISLLKAGIFFLVLVFVWSALPSSRVQAEGSLSNGTAVAMAAEQVTNFDATYRINPDSSVDVTESIQYDFGNSQRHGIYRYIPLFSSQNKRIYITVNSVTNATGASYHFTESSTAKKLRIKIGDGNALVTGVYRYVINYNVRNSLGYFDSFDEFYWNVTGNDWQVPILESSATVILPRPLPEQNIRRACYAGYKGSNTFCSGSSLRTLKDGNSDQVMFTQQELRPGAGLTVAAGFPKGLVTPAPEPFSLGDLIRKYGWMSLIFPVSVFWFLFRKWSGEGRDPKGTGVIIPQYDVPDGLTPMEVAAFARTTIKPADSAAEVIYLATRGYLKIERVETKQLLFKNTDYRLTKLKDPANLSKEADISLMRGLFDNADGQGNIDMSSLSGQFYSTVKSVQDEVYKFLIANDYLKNNPVKTKALYFVGGASILFLSVFLSGIFLGPWGVLSALSVAALFFIFGALMPARTQKGQRTREYILGLKDYLRIAEKDRLAFHNAPEKNPAIFEKLLPYAMVLGVEKAWAKEFQDIYTVPPSWYHDPAGGAFSSIIFVQQMSLFNSFALDGITSTSGGSGGGGFSGGGGGGGGGGSW